MDMLETNRTASSRSELVLRSPRREDGARIWQLVQRVGSLEPNTCYAYLLLASDFCETSVLAERDGKLVGFVVGYRPPKRPQSVFVWQVGVAPEARGTGLGKKLLRELMDANAGAGVKFLEATVAPSNTASRSLFKAVARDAGVPCRVSQGFVPQDFHPLDHEAEELMKLGPFGGQVE